MYTDKKRIFLIYNEIQMEGVAKSYVRKGFLIYEEIRKYLTIYEEAVGRLCLCNRSRLNFLIFEENFILFFISVHCTVQFYASLKNAALLFHAHHPVY
jgi:hypothetical protein